MASSHNELTRQRRTTTRSQQIGIDQEVFDEEVIDAREQHGKVSALQETHTAQGDTSTVTECQSLVGLRHTPIAASRTIAFQHIGAIDKPLPFDGQVVQIFAPKERVVPMTVPIVLITRLVGFGLVVAFGIGHRSRLDDSTTFEAQGDARTQMDGIAEISAFGNDHQSPTRRSSTFDGGIDGRRIDVPSVTQGTEVTHVERQASAQSQERQEEG